LAGEGGEGAACPRSVFVFQESVRANPFNFVSTPNKAHAQDLPGNLHTIKVTALVHHMMVIFHVSNREHQADSIILIIRNGYIIFHSIYIERNVSYNEKKVKSCVYTESFKHHLT